MSVDIVKLLVLGILIDAFVFYVAGPALINDPAPPPAQFVVWESIFTVIGLGVVYVSRAKKGK